MLTFSESEEVRGCVSDGARKSNIVRGRIGSPQALGKTEGLGGRGLRVKRFSVIGWISRNILLL